MSGDRSDPTSPNYRVSIRAGDIPQEHMDAMLADMRERAARAAKALRILDETVPDVPPDEGDEIDDRTGPWARLRAIEDAHPEAPHVVSGGLADEFIEEEVASWAETWIAGVDGVVLGHGQTRDAAIEDALDFANAVPEQAAKLDVLQATPALARLIGLIPLHYVVRDGRADVP